MAEKPANSRRIVSRGHRGGQPWTGLPTRPPAEPRASIAGDSWGTAVPAAGVSPAILCRNRARAYSRPEKLKLSGEQHGLLKMGKPGRRYGSMARASAEVLPSNASWCHRQNAKSLAVPGRPKPSLIWRRTVFQFLCLGAFPMKRQHFLSLVGAVALLVFGNATSAEAFGFGRLGGGCCGAAASCCAPEPSCCAPAPTCCCDPAPVCCDPCGSCCRPRMGLLARLHARCCKPKCCDPCGCEASCGCAAPCEASCGCAAPCRSFLRLCRSLRSFLRLCRCIVLRSVLRSVLR